MEKPSERLFNIVNEMCAANEMTCQPVEKWPSHLSEQFHISTLNEQASLVPDDEISTFTDGLDTDVDKLVLEFDLSQLHSFLNEVFDGSLHREMTIYPK